MDLDDLDPQEFNETESVEEALERYVTAVNALESIHTHDLDVCKTALGDIEATIFDEAWGELRETWVERCDVPLSGVED